MGSRYAVATAFLVMVAGCGSDGSGSDTSSAGAGASAGNGGAAGSGTGGTSATGGGGSSGATTAGGSAGIGGAGVGGLGGATAGGSGGATAGSANAGGQSGAENGGQGGDSGGSGGTTGGTAGGSGGEAGGAGGEAGAGGGGGSGGSSSAYCGFVPTVDCSGLATVTSSMFCENESQAICALRVRCNQVAPGDEDACRKLYTVECEATGVEKAIADGRRVLDGDAAACCGALVAAGSCEGTLFYDHPTCLARVTGAAAVGDPCYDKGDCQSGSCDLVLGCPGTCAATVVAGKSCSSATCRPGLFCSNTKVCGPRGCADAPCAKQIDCQDGLTCNLSGGTTGTCQPIGKIGDPCINSSYIPNACDRAVSSCRLTSGANGICKALGGPGDGCKYDWDCGGAGYCNAGTCAATLADGATCNTSSAFQYSGQCGLEDCSTGGVCAPMPVLGEACDVKGNPYLTCQSPFVCNSMGVCDNDPTACVAP